MGSVEGNLLAILISFVYLKLHTETFYTLSCGWQDVMSIVSSQFVDFLFNYVSANIVLVENFLVETVLKSFHVLFPAQSLFQIH